MGGRRGDGDRESVRMRGQAVAEEGLGVGGDWKGLSSTFHLNSLHHSSRPPPLTHPIPTPPRMG